MRIYILDDEAHARGLARRFLEREKNLEIVGEQGDPVAAIGEINRLRPDLVFLDIDMPGLSGFEVLPFLEHRPLIVFLTAYDSFAIQAFEVRALDYVLKPPTPERLRQSLERARDQWTVLEELSAEKREPMTKIVCSEGNHYQVVWVRDIVLFTKADHYTAIQVREGRTWYTNLTINYLEENLHNPDFFRINRGGIVHRTLVTSFDGLPSGQIQANLDGGETIRVSRRRARAFRDWLAGGEPVSP